MRFLTLLSTKKIFSSQKAMLLSLCFLWLCWLGYNWTVWRFYPTPLPENVMGKLLIVEGSINGLVTRKPDKEIERFTLTIDRVEKGVGISCDRSFRVRLSRRVSEDAPIIKGGDRWRFVVRLKRPNGQASMGSSNYEDWLFENRIQATGYVHNDYLAERLASSPWWHNDTWRSMLVKHINATVPIGDGRALLKALVLGDRSEVSQKTWSALIATGTSHLLAISGLHIGLIAVFFGYMGGLLWRRSHRLCLILPAPMIMTVCALSGGFLYAGLAGFSIPTVRAVIMLSIACLGFLSKRYLPTWFILFIALIAVSSTQPQTILSAGFVLSFIATAIILTMVRRSNETEKKWFFWIRLQLTLTVVMYPIVIWYFGQVSWISAMVNLIAVPLVGWVVLPSVLAIVVLSLILPKLLLGADWILGTMAKLLYYFEYISGGVIDWSKPAIWQIVIATVLLWFVCLGKGSWRSQLSCIILCVIILYPMVKQPEKGHANIAVLDVGQGLSVLIMTRHHTMVFDTGLEGMGRRIISPAIRYFGRREPDVIAISHNDSDHIGGLKWLQARYPSAKAVQNDNCIGSWRWDGVSFVWLSTEGFTGNNRSCVLKVVAHNETILLTGDIERKAEESLMKRYDLKSNWLLSPHHGSKTSSSLPFLQEVAGESVLISAGFRSRYGHPHHSVIKRYRQLGMEVYSTVCSGSILIRLGAGDTIPVLEWRKHKRKFWWRQCDSIKI